MIDHPTHSVASLIEFLPAHWFDDDSALRRTL